MPLNPESRQDIIQYRCERSYSTFKEAQFAAKEGFWNLVANRLYYSVFYISEALLLSYGIPTNSHAGVARMISLNFVKNNQLSLEDGKLLSRLFRMRQTGDYDDLFYWTKEDLEHMFPQVHNLISKIESLIKKG